MPRSIAHRFLCSAGVIVGLLGGSSAVSAGTDTEQKGAQVYCFMRSSGNAHNVSWNAAYALIKRQSHGLFKTSPEHASVMITEAVVKDPARSLTAVSSSAICSAGQHRHCSKP